MYFSISFCRRLLLPAVTCFMLLVIIVSNIFLAQRHELPMLAAEEMRNQFLCQESPPFADPKSVTECGLSADRYQLYNNLLWWKLFARKFNLTWFLIYGSLLGQYRHKDIIQYDTDMDVGLLIENNEVEHKLRVSSDRLRIVYGKPNLIFRPGAYCPKQSGYHQKMNCYGEYQTYMQDSCSFCEPLARVIFKGYRMLWSYGSSSYLDIFKHISYEINGTRQILFEGMSMQNVTYNNYSWYFPLQQCIFMNLTGPCPNKPKELMQSYLYGDLQPSKKCLNKKWVNAS